MSAPRQHGSTSVKETLVSIVIAFAFAFVFRAFVVEAFIIPTGSMAPTLMGAHMRLTNPVTGNRWPVGPHFYYPAPSGATSREPKPVQGQRPDMPVRVNDPMLGPPSDDKLSYTDVPRSAGDRILVFKYLYSVYDPSRFDIVVFKNPVNPQENFIKRLIGLAGEQIALVDGDVFVRRPPPGEPESRARDTWSSPGWTIARKPERVQRTVWQPVFDSRYTPLDPMRDGRVWFQSPWVGDGAGWRIEGLREYEFTGAGPAALTWNGDENSGGWPIDDWHPYDDAPMPPDRQGAVFPVSDVRLICAIHPARDTRVGVAAVLRARGHEFRGALSPGAGSGWNAAVQMRPVSEGQGPDDNWTTLGAAEVPVIDAPGGVMAVEFWHADQCLQLWVGGTKLCEGTYAWTPDQRLRNATGLSVAQVLELDQDRAGSVLAMPDTYARPRVSWQFSGGPFTLRRVAVERDLHYQATTGQFVDQTHRFALATHPISSPSLGPDQFFVCGDNSPCSHDARLWGDPDPWVAAEIDATRGIVPRDLLIGKAFFVYFPSLLRGPNVKVPVPDFGRMRFIW